MSLFGDRLAELREDRGLSQVELGKAFHLSNSAISAYEKGRRMPSAEMVIELAKFFNVTSDYLLGLTSSSVQLDSLTEAFHGDTAFIDAVYMMRNLDPELRAAINIILKKSAGPSAENEPAARGKRKAK